MIARRFSGVTLLVALVVVTVASPAAAMRVGAVEPASLAQEKVDLSGGKAPRFETAVTPTAITTGAWSALGGNADGALNSFVHAVAVSGSDVYVGGNFVNVAGIPQADFVAKWNGSAWSALGSNPAGTDGAINSPVYALSFLADGRLIVGGDFFDAGGDLQADDLAVFDGVGWSDLAGATSGDGAFNGQVYALARNGANLYVGGFFNNAPVIGSTNPNPGDMILRWDGSWHALGQRPCCTDTGNGSLNGTVRALAATATGVIAGGDFSDVNGNAAIDRLAEYTLSTGDWAALGSGQQFNGPVRALAQSGSGVYVGGSFTDAAGLPNADYVALWNGTSWSALGTSPLNATVYAIAVSGSNVWVGGHFTDAGGLQPADRVARRNGNTWAPLGSNGANDGALNTQVADPPGAVTALAVSANALYAGGSFRNAQNVPQADFVSPFGLGSTSNQKSDGRIRKGSGTLVGNNIYNTTGLNQTRTGSAGVNGTITFTISIQNDGTQSGKFKVAATASGNVNFQVTYLRGTTDITSAVVNGTYLTGSVAPGSVWAITAKVKVMSSVVSGASTTRLITITSNADSSKVDAVKLIGKRT